MASRQARRRRTSPVDNAVRYAVVGLGYIAQESVLPAFRHASANSELVALVSDDPTKLKKLGRKYGVARLYSYDEYDACLASGEIDAVYIALPNSLHCDYTVRAARAGVHILCEKPMAVMEEECARMIRAADEANVKLMIAYRLHFEKANLTAVQIAKSGRLGELRAFSSVFTMQVKSGNTRLRRDLGGGTLYDIGIYCINAARYLFQDEPTEVWATAANNGEERFSEVEEAMSAVMRFPGERLAAFTCSFGASDVSAYQLVGTKGDLRADPAYELATGLKLHVTVGGKKQQYAFAKSDQFAPELLYFSECVKRKKNPEPSGEEGLADVRIIQALYRSAERGETIRLTVPARDERPSLKQEIRRPPVSKQKLVHAESPSGKS
jgi:glucose-fructose oxidoreductase